jgi:hypothetical protein
MQGLAGRRDILYESLAAQESCLFAEVDARDAWHRNTKVRLWRPGVHAPLESRSASSGRWWRNASYADPMGRPGARM